MMKYAYAFTKLYLASILGGLCMRYALPANVDIPISVGSFIYNLVTTQTVGSIVENFNLNDYLLALMILPIMLGPLIYAIIIGKWGVWTFIFGFFGGYYLYYFGSLYLFANTFSILVLIITILLLTIGIIVTFYARTR